MQEERQTAVVPADTRRALTAPAKRAGYFATVSSCYKHAFRILLIVLVLFLVIFSCFFYRTFSYENFFYFIKDLSSLSGAVSGRTSVSYTYHEGEAAFADYHGGLVRVSRAGVEIFGSDGVRELLDERSFRSPRLAVSRKYAVVYEYAGKDFYIYNSYTMLHHGTAEAPILGVSASDAGELALLTSSESALSAVTVYDSHFAPVQRFERALATTGISLSTSGKQIALLGTRAEGGALVSVLEVYRVGSTEPLCTRTYTGEFSDLVQFLDRKALFCVTSAGVRFLSADGEELGECLFGEQSLLALDSAGRDGVALALGTGDPTGRTEIVLLDRKGRERLRYECAAAPRELSLGEDAIYALCDGELRRIDLSGVETVHTCPSDVLEIFSADRGCVALVRGALTEYDSSWEP